VDDWENFFTNGHHNALMTERSNRIFYGFDVLDDGPLCQDIFFLTFLEPFKKIVQDHYF
jgi:hypothetical protein